MKDVIAFDIWGDYAHFKKYFTTTSPLTFSLPPRTVLMGIIGAICGLNKEQYIEAFTRDRADIAVSILNPIKKFRIAENLIDTKTAQFMGRIKNRTQIKLEFIKDPRYRIFVSLQDAHLHSSFKEMLLAHKCVYTPYLGISELIANFRYINEYHAERKMTDECINIVSAVNNDLVRYLNIETNKEYFSEVMPNDMERQRIVNSYSKIIYERNGQNISATVTECFEVGRGEHITFL